MATLAATKTAPSLETTIKNAVKNWAKAEQSAIWVLIRASHKALEGLTGPDRDKRVSALKTWINSSIDAEFGEGEAAKRSAHVSKVLSIALNATPKHFERWTREGTGFYKAYSEFAVPQANPASSKKSDKKKPEVVEVPTTAGETGAAAGVAQQAVPDPDAPASADQKQSVKQAASQEPAGPAPINNADPTPAWATRIQQDAGLWRSLISHLTEKKDFILTPIHVQDLFKALTKKEVIFRNSVEIILTMESVRKIIADSIRNEPGLFKEIVSVVLVQNVAAAKQ